MSFERYNATGPVSTAAHYLENPDGDSPGDELLKGGSLFKGHCFDCRKPYTAYVPPHQKVMSKFKCRSCGYIHEVQVRKKCMDQIEEHLDEGAWEQKVRNKTDGSRGTRRPTISLSRKEQLDIELQMGWKAKVQTPWGNGTLIE